MSWKSWASSVRSIRLRMTSPRTPEDIQLYKMLCDVCALEMMRDRAHKHNFAFQFLATRYSQATDPRDKVYGILSLPLIPLGSHFPLKTSDIMPDYTKSIEYVFVEAAKMLATSKPCQLFGKFPLRPLMPRHLPAALPSSMLVLPTWAPNLTLPQSSRDRGY
jgi:hypothetical protein